jgi:hypothetical protein
MVITRRYPETKTPLHFESEMRGQKVRRALSEMR